MICCRGGGSSPPESVKLTRTGERAGIAPTFLMNKELEIWQFIASKLKQNELVMLLVVAESGGSSPGRQGFKMAVAENEMAGSIGGGVMEVNLVELAKEKLKSKKEKGKSKIQNPKSKIVKQVHRENSPDSSGMICSGQQKVVFFELNPQNLKTVLEIIRALKTHEPKTLQISNSELRILKEKSADFSFRFEKKSENDFIYEEKLGYKNYLSIVGGGHCALALSELMSKMDFYISLYDDRRDLNTLKKNKFVHAKTLVESYENIDEFIASGARHYVVVMTLGYRFDEIVIRRLIDKDFKYFGVLGSRAKMKILLKNLEKAGYPKEKLNRIHAPIGLAINSRTPEEIAISIAAEIIKVKNQ